MEGGAVPTRSKWVHWGLEKEENWMGILGPGGPSFLTPPAAVPGGTAIAESRRGKPELAPGTWTDLRKPQAPFRESGRGNGVRGKVSDYIHFRGGAGPPAWGIQPCCLAVMSPCLSQGLRGSGRVTDRPSKARTSP